MRGNKAYWIGGSLIALLGVALVRLLAPALAGAASSLAAGAGYFVVFAGIMVVARATGRKHAAALPAHEQEAKD